MTGMDLLILGAGFFIGCGCTALLFASVDNG